MHSALKMQLDPDGLLYSVSLTKTCTMTVNADQLLQLFAPLPFWIRFVFPGIWCYL